MRMLNTLAIAAAAVATVALIPHTASADRVCREVCRGSICEQKCVETRDRDIRAEDRGVRRDEGREERREHQRPGVELRVPGVGIEIGR